ncbi:MAG: flagellar export chaperone FliS [Candidatus Sulfotelmatobacter sp.]
MDAGYSYREAVVRGASPARLVLCLYEQAIEDLRRAIVAQESGDVEGRTRGVNHALLVIAHLQGTLDMERGGEVAKNLSKFYSVIRAGIIEAHAQQSATMIERQISHLALVHEAWLEVDRATSPAAPESNAAAQTGKNDPAPLESSFVGWNA